MEPDLAHTRDFPRGSCLPDAALQQDVIYEERMCMHVLHRFQHLFISLGFSNQCFFLKTYCYNISTVVRDKRTCNLFILYFRPFRLLCVDYATQMEICMVFSFYTRDE